MIQIFIDDQVKNKAKKFYDGMFQRNDIQMKHPKPRLRKLKNNLRPKKDKDYRIYLDLLIDNYKEIQLATPVEMKNWEKKFDEILPKAKLNNKIPYRKWKFWESVVHALRYTNLQSFEFPNYMREENIKACVYCNAQYTLSVISTYYDQKKMKKVKSTRPKYQIDHYYPKSKYPYLATSFFNLYPSCASCNNVKRENKANFELYTENEVIVEFEYHLDDDDVLEYYLTKGKNAVKVYVGPKNGSIKLKENHEHLFSIQGVANEQNDLIEELLLKSKIYTPSYKKSLVESLSEIFPDTSIIDRLILGNYTKPEDILKRPFSKMNQDIASQLKLL